MWFGNKKEAVPDDETAMREMMTLLDEWQAPEPTPWFDARMMARFREEQAREPQDLFARLRDRWLFGNSDALKPAMITALAVLMVAGGGGYWQMQHTQPANQPAVSATVHDLQSLDNNDQTLQQMSQLLDEGDDGTPQS